VSEVGIITLAGLVVYLAGFSTTTGATSIA